MSLEGVRRNMGDPIIIWPPDCGNYSPGDENACYGAGMSPCYDGSDVYWYEAGYVTCC